MLSSDIQYQILNYLQLNDIINYMFMCKHIYKLM